MNSGLNKNIIIVLLTTLTTPLLMCLKLYKFHSYGQIQSLLCFNYYIYILAYVNDCSRTISQKVES